VLAVELRDLVYLDASAIAGNFTRAAKSLGLQTSTISRRIGQIEDELGLALFERGHAGVHLTSSGKALLPHIRRALAELNTIRHVGKQTSSGFLGEIRLGVRKPPMGKPLRNLLVDWRQELSGAVLMIFEMNELEIRTAMRERRIDTALMTRHMDWPDVASAPIQREQLLAALPRAHPLARRRTVDWDALKGEIFLVQGWGHVQADREYYASLIGNGATFRSHAASHHSILALVAAGAGITVVGQSQAEVAIPGVAYRPICEDNAWEETELIWNPTAEDPVVGRFVAFMRDQARSRKLF
jgi:DNA-binding transcriptional LysR family regulator